MTITIDSENNIVAHAGSPASEDGRRETSSLATCSEVRDKLILPAASQAGQVRKLLANVQLGVHCRTQSSVFQWLISTFEHVLIPSFRPENEIFLQTPPTERARNRAPLEREISPGLFSPQNSATKGSQRVLTRSRS